MKYANKQCRFWATTDFWLDHIQNKWQNDGGLLCQVEWILKGGNVAPDGLAKSMMTFYELNNKKKKRAVAKAIKAIKNTLSLKQAKILHLEDLWESMWYIFCMFVFTLVLHTFMFVIFIV